MEGPPLGVAGIEQTVAIGVEHLAQRLHVAVGGRIPIGKNHLLLAGDLAVAIGVDHQHAVADARPGGAVVIAVVAEVEIMRAVVTLGDRDPVTIKVEQDRAFATAAAAVASGRGEKPPNRTEKPANCAGNSLGTACRRSLDTLL